MKLIPHVQNVVARWLTARANAVAKRKGANAKNIVAKFVAPFAQANLNARHRQLSHH